MIAAATGPSPSGWSFCLTVIIGIVALGMDGGRMMDERRRAQGAADAAALAGAADLYLNYGQNCGKDPNGTAIAAAQANALANGYSNDGSSSTVTVNIPPTSGSFAGKNDYLEVIIQSNLEASFSAIFTGGPLRVRARAVARGRPMKFGLLLLGTGGPELSLSGNASLKVLNASIVADSTDSQAYQISGNASVSADSHDLGGGAPVCGNIVGQINTYMPPISDPLASLAVPDLTQFSVQANSTVSVGGNQSMALQPGVYYGGINLSGNAQVTLAAGVYILVGGGLTLSGNASLSGQGVMLYNTGGASASVASLGGVGAGSISLNCNGSISLSPPTSGPYQGISFFQDRSLTQGLEFSGNGSLQITGAVYAASAPVTLSGNGDGNTVGGSLIVASVQASGDATFTISQGTAGPRVPDVGLVE
jgi:hypothetical protein